MATGDGEADATVSRTTHLLDRAAVAGVALDATTARALVDYLGLVRRWNARMNLTALRDMDRAVDRLIVEPLAAAKHVPLGASLIDIGSGNGSPAIPLRIARPDLASVRLVESKMRKGVFLRETIRQLRLHRVVVENERFETLLANAELHNAHDILTLRGVAWDVGTLLRLQRFLRPRGLLYLFTSERAEGAGEDDLEFRTPLVWQESRALVLPSEVGLSW